MRKRAIVGIVPWGNVLEDYLDGIGVSLRSFCTEMTGGWLFGYVEALRSAGVDAVIFCMSARVREPTRIRHEPTGARICVLPSPRSYRFMRRHMASPYDSRVRRTTGPARNWPGSASMAMAWRDVSFYTATPLRSLAREIRRAGCSAVLCQEYEYARFDVCVLLGRLLRLPVFATFQGGDWQITRLERLARPRAIHACAGLIIGPKTEVDRVTATYQVSPEKIGRVFNPIDLSEWNRSDASGTREALGIPQDARVVAWHGRVDVHRKGLDVLMEAWGCIRRANGPDLRLMLIGTGVDSAWLRRLIVERGLRGVHWIDEYIMDRDRMRRYLSAADLYVFPSRHEGFPVAPIEAMACGLPLVAADAPGIPDILEGGERAGGVIVPKGDAAALQQALSAVLEDDAWSRRLGARARRRVESSFETKAVGDQLRDYLETRSLNLGYTDE